MKAKDYKVPTEGVYDYNTFSTDEALLPIRGGGF